MPPFISLVGQRFGQLVATEVVRKGNRIFYKCKCDCGGFAELESSSLKGGTSKRHCGCIKQANNYRHGHATANNPSSTYQCWSAMKRRCENPNCKDWDDYGGRGIIVCDRWQKFENFLLDMGEKPKGLSIDRYPDNDGNYEPGNVRWATDIEQANNKRNNKRKM
jgi:hypothetical protein